MVIKKRPLSLRMIFFEYLAAMGAALVLSFLVPFFIQTALVSTGFCSYANSSEIAAKNAQPTISGADKFGSSLVPPSSSYVFLSGDFTVIESNMDNTELKDAVNYAKGKYRPGSPDDCYLTIKRKDGICLLHYYVRSQYRDKKLNGFMPSPDKLMKVLIILNGIISIFVCSTFFAGRLKKQLQPVLNATQKIKERDLDFEVPRSGITEFNDILLSISDMKSELKHSLEQQWRMEQAKKEQMSALAHDIKTPLTVVRGNAELLRDSKMTDGQQEYNRYILKNADRMEQYLNMLIGLTKAESGYTVHLQKIQTQKFMKDLLEQANGLAAARKLQIDAVQHNLPAEFTADCNLLGRAIMNVVSNAMDYTPDRGTVKISAEAVENSISFCVTDSGKGFSPEGLKQATAQFYMGDKSRGLNAHFGIGLYIAETIAKLHRGTLSLSNSSESGGGQVTINIPV